MTNYIFKRGMWDVPGRRKPALWNLATYQVKYLGRRVPGMQSENAGWEMYQEEGGSSGTFQLRSGPNAGLVSDEFRIEQQSGDTTTRPNPQSMQGQVGFS